MTSTETIARRRIAAENRQSRRMTTGAVVARTLQRGLVSHAGASVRETLRVSRVADAETGG